ncbi:TetR/AcrR family transcriptional regulator [Pseudonocardia xishanensis]|uniref:TetR/AcrR family transcriptional regulator C-terminal domain-containing protein n=1 Tax=Pseudonocardia xishanensis TaxID=630995 RepID=A0ABP8RUA6_9PSEU
MPESRSIWLRRERSGRGPTPEHGRDRIAAAAIDLADAGGLDAVSTRRVAAAIGAGATSLYRYVRSRDELLELMLDTATGELDLTAPVTGDWRGDLLVLAHDLRAVYRRHPWLLDLAQGQAPLTPRSVAFLEYALAILRDVQAPGGAKMEAIALATGLVAQLTRLEVAAGRSSADWQAAQVEYLTAIVAEGRHPNLSAAIAAPGGAGDGEDVLDRVLPRVVAGVLGIA